MNRVTLFAATAALALGSTAAMAGSASAPISSPGVPLASPRMDGPVSYEEHLAAVEVELAYQAPIAQVENNYWFDYQTDLAEARKELTKDLRGASDAEDNRDAWEEYRAELADARGDYAKQMAEKGYPIGEVRVLEDAGR
jgi:hypothetical protein